MGTSLLLNFRTNQEVVMKQNKSIVVVVLTIFFSFILLSGTVSAQSFSGYKDFRFGMKRNDIIPIVNRTCSGLLWDRNIKYDELTDTKDGSIRGNQCYKIFGKNRDVYLNLYSNTGDLYQIKVTMDSMDKKTPNVFVQQFLKVRESLKQKYRLDIPINEDIFKRWLDDEFEAIYEIYNDGKVILSLEDHRISFAIFKSLYVIYNNDHLARESVTHAKKVLSTKSDNF